MPINAEASVRFATMNIDTKRIKANFSAYNRLEARPRTQAFERSLRAEVRDPLWLLTRQWQFGEFEGEDAGSPVKARILYTHTPMHRLSFGENPGKTIPFDGRTMPLETKVERETVALVTDRRAPGDTVTSPHSDLLFGIRLGKDFWSRLGAADTPSNRQKLLEKYPFKVFEKDQAAAQVAAAVAGLVPDGCALFRDTTTSAFELWVDSEPTLTNIAALKAAAAVFATDHTARFGRMFSQPANEGDSAWLTNRLEYSFQISEEPTATNNQAPLVLAADEYFHDRLDWYAFDLARRRVLPPLEADPTDVAVNPPLELAR